jgi:hypothetical protein
VLQTLAVGAVPPKSKSIQIQIQKLS